MENERMIPAEINRAELAEFGGDITADLTSGRAAYCSFNAEDDKGRALLFNISNQTPEAIADHVGETLEVTDVYAEYITLERVDDMTGAVIKKEVPRIVLITKQGVGYGAVSIGIHSAVKRLFAVFGTPDQWSKPRKLKIKQVNRGERRLLTFDVVE